MRRPLIVTFVGVPGSGKTTFAKQLSGHLQAVVLSSDSMRLAMWESLEGISGAHSTAESRKQSNELLFNGLNYVTKQIVKAGSTVIFDANANRRQERQEKHDIATASGALSVVVRISVPYGVSLHRLQFRSEGNDSRQFSKEKAAEVIDHFAAEIEEPDEDETTIFLDGEAPFDVQYDAFTRAIRLQLA